MVVSLCTYLLLIWHALRHASPVRHHNRLLLTIGERGTVQSRPLTGRRSIFAFWRAWPLLIGSVSTVSRELLLLRGLLLLSQQHLLLVLHLLSIAVTMLEFAGQQGGVYVPLNIALPIILHGLPCELTRCESLLLRIAH